MSKNETYHAEVMALNKRLYGDDYPERTNALANRAISGDHSALEEAKEWLCEAHPFVIRLEHYLLMQSRKIQNNG